MKILKKSLTAVKLSSQLFPKQHFILNPSQKKCDEKQRGRKLV
jgi:hypothetical protein